MSFCGKFVCSCVYVVYFSFFISSLFFILAKYIALLNALLFVFFQFFFFLFDIIQCSYLSDIHCCVSVAVFVNSLLCAVNNNTSIQFTTDSTTIHSTQTSDYSHELTILDFIIDRINVFLFAIHFLLAISSNYVYVKVCYYCITNTHTVYT